jgi:hypothetical protein
MADLARSQGFYDVVRLNDQQATMNNVRRYIGWAANDLRRGDIFLISISSHGSYRTDSTGDEVDGRDETWCLWDGQWSDDERYVLWQRFAPGVRILVVADLCHSGTTAKALQTLEGLERARALNAESAELERSTRSLRGSRSIPPGNIVQPRDILEDLDPAAVENLKRYAARLQEAAAERDEPNPDDERFGEKFNLDGPSPIRSMPDQLAEFLSAVQPERSPAPGEPRSGDSMRASGLLLSACQDSQTALDGARNGVFTNALKLAWNSGNFQGSYETFYATLLQLLRNYPTHQPNRDLFGSSDGHFHQERPFQVS